VKKNPKATIALIKGVIEAQQWLDKAGNKDEAAKILSSRKWYNTPEPVINRALKGGTKWAPAPSPRPIPAWDPCSGRAIAV
jgi:bicarbonate transport system substrate-binding protein